MENYFNKSLLDPLSKQTRVYGGIIYLVQAVRDQSSPKTKDQLLISNSLNSFSIFILSSLFIYTRPSSPSQYFIPFPHCFQGKYQYIVFSITK